MNEATHNITKTFGPYSSVREAGAFVFVSGQVGIDPDTGTAAPDAQGQTRQALLNAATALQQVGLTLHDVASTTVYLTDMGHFQAVNNEYAQHFTAPFPARACVAVAELPRVGNGTPMFVEIALIAQKRQA